MNKNRNRNAVTIKLLVWYPQFRRGSFVFGKNIKEYIIFFYILNNKYVAFILSSISNYSSLTQHLPPLYKTSSSPWTYTYAHLLQINWLNRHTVILNGPKETISVSSTLIFNALLSPSPSTSTFPDKPPGIVRRMATPEMLQSHSASVC